MLDRVSKERSKARHSTAKKGEILGMPFGTAKYQLSKILLFDLAGKAGLLSCFRCDAVIETIEEFSIEHKENWRSSPAPREAFFDLGNIAFSHLACNHVHGLKTRQSVHGWGKYRSGCRCDVCVAAKRENNRKWMARWRESGRDKSRSNYSGP